MGDGVSAQENRGNGVGCDGGGSVELRASDISGNKQVGRLQDLARPREPRCLECLGV